MRQLDKEVSGTIILAPLFHPKQVRRSLERAWIRVCQSQEMPEEQGSPRGVPRLHLHREFPVLRESFFGPVTPAFSFSQDRS